MQLYVPLEGGKSKGGNRTEQRKAGSQVLGELCRDVSHLVMRGGKPAGRRPQRAENFVVLYDGSEHSLFLMSP
jgi:hypothetical protein